MSDSVFHFHSNDSLNKETNNLTKNQSNLNKKLNNDKLMYNTNDNIEITIISKCTMDKGTQTKFDPLYKIEENSIKENRKFQSDLIRDK